MTGFGAGEVKLGSHLLRVELRSVNHRHLDVRVRLPAELSEVGPLVEEMVRARCTRGRIEAQGLWQGDSPSGAELDMDRARRAYRELLQLRDELAPTEPVPLSTLFAVPGVFVSKRWQRSEVEAVLRVACERALDDLLQMRAREGEALAADLLHRLRLLRTAARVITQLRPQVLEAAQRRLTKRIEKLLEGSAIALDPARLTQEVAWFAERCDVAEELTRLDSHIEEFSRSLAHPGEAVGRKLDFMVQELGRELNTLGAKANDADISRRVVEMKTELERIREQVQNIL